MAENSEYKKQKYMSNVPGSDLLTQAEMEALVKEAEAKIKEDKKKEVKRRILEEKIREENARIDPNEEVFEFKVFLPKFASHLLINDTPYYHKQTYKFTRKQLNSILPLIQSMWNHQRAVSGEAYDDYIERLSDVLTVKSLAA